VTRGFDVSGDIALSSDERHLLLAQGPTEIVDRIRVGLETLAGTWAYDLRVGVRYWDQIFEKPASVGLALLRSEITRIVRETPGVVSVGRVAVSFDRATRTASVAWSAQTDAGAIRDLVVLR